MATEKKKKPFKFFIYPGNYSHYIRDYIEQQEDWQQQTEDTTPFQISNFIWKPVNPTTYEYSKIDKGNKIQPSDFKQAFNHFEYNAGICTKNQLIRCLRKYYGEHPEAKKANYDVFETTPTSFILTAGHDDFEQQFFLSRYKELAKKLYYHERVPAKHCKSNWWLLKPINQNQGKGIAMFNSLRDIKSFMSSKVLSSQWVAQKYVERPLLYKGRKFDLRIWVLVTASHEVFVYRQGYIRTSSDDYSLNNHNTFVHLTNQCLQQNNSNYGKHEEGNTLTLDALDEYFREKYPDEGLCYKKHFFPRICDIIIDTYLAYKDNFNPNKRAGSFELFGYDFIIDEDLRTWLIEVNTNPYLGAPSKTMMTMINSMIEDMLEIALLPVTKIQRKDPAKKNQYKLIYCEENSVFSKEKVNKRRKFTESPYPIEGLTPNDYIKRVQDQQNYDLKHPEPAAPTTTGGQSQEAKTQKMVQSYQPSAKAKDALAEIEKMDNPDAQNESLLEFFYKSLFVEPSENEVKPPMIMSDFKKYLNILATGENLTLKSKKFGSKTIKYLQNCKHLILLINVQTLTQFFNIVKSPLLPIILKSHFLDTIKTLSKQIHFKKNMINNKYLHELIEICMTTCSERTLNTFDAGLRMKSIECLEIMGGIFDRRVYIPGQTREMIKLRDFFITQGGLISMWTLSAHSMDNFLKEKALSNFLANCEFKDWEFQLKVMKVYLKYSNKENNAGGNTQLHPLAQSTGSPNSSPLKSPRFIRSLNGPSPTGENDSQKSSNLVRDKSAEPDNSAEKKPTDIFYKSGNLKALTVSMDQEIEDINLYNQFKDSISLPKCLLTVFQTYDELLNSYSEFLDQMKSAQNKKELEEKNRKLHNLQKMKHEEENRKKEIEVKRKEAFEEFENRVKEKQRKERESRLKQLHHFEVMKRQEEEDRKLHIQYLMQKKATPTGASVNSSMQQGGIKKSQLLKRKQVSNQNEPFIGAATEISAQIAGPSNNDQEGQPLNTEELPLLTQNNRDVSPVNLHKKSYKNLKIILGSAGSEKLLQYSPRQHYEIEPKSLKQKRQLHQIQELQFKQELSQLKTQASPPHSFYRNTVVQGDSIQKPNVSKGYTPASESGKKKEVKLPSIFNERSSVNDYDLKAQRRSSATENESTAEQRGGSVPRHLLENQSAPETDLDKAATGPNYNKIVFRANHNPIYIDETEANRELLLQQQQMQQQQQQQQQLQQPGKYLDKDQQQWQYDPVVSKATNEKKKGRKYNPYKEDIVILMSPIGGNKRNNAKKPHKPNEMMSNFIHSPYFPSKGKV